MPPNLLFVFCDELRRDAVGYSGNPDVQTPAIDKLASGGVSFTHAVANTPVCTPSRGCLLTGCWPQRHGAIGNDLPVDPTAPSIARALNSAGYRCGYIGKWHLGGIPRARFLPPGPELLGFDAYWASWNCHHQYMRPRYHRDSSEPILAEGYEPAVQTDLAVRFLQDHHERRQEQPFCLFLSWGPPHGPYRPLPPGYEERYDPARLPLRPNAVDTAAERADLAGYYAHITAIDDQFARLIGGIEQQGLLDETLIVFGSDHGSMLGSHGYHNKQFPYEESCGVPLAMRWPAHLPSGATSNVLIGIVDYAPTLLGLLGVAIPASMQGRNLAPCITADVPGPDSQYLQELLCGDQARQAHMLPWRAVRTGHATYARTTAGPWLLFDNARDPYQQHNLVGATSARTLQEALESLLERHMYELDDPLEPPEAVLSRYGKTEAWAAREAFLSVGRNMAGEAPLVAPFAPETTTDGTV